MYGDVINFTESTVITLFSMGMVFAVLVFLSFMISILKLGNKQKPKQEIRKVEKVITAQRKEEEEDEQELIAVLAAAIAMETGQNPSQFRIRNIKKVEHQTAAWTRAAMQDHVASRF